MRLDNELTAPYPLLSGHRKRFHHRRRVLEEKKKYNPDAGLVLNLTDTGKGATVWDDQSGFGNNGAVGGNAAPTPLGYALDGTDDYIRVDYSNSIALNANMTVSAWVYFVDNSKSHAFIRKGSEAGTDITFLWYWIGAGAPANNISLYSAGGEALAPFVPSLVTWYHIVVVLDAAGNVSHYINSVFSANTPASTAVQWTDDTDPLMIGEWSTFDFQGNVDDVRIYNRQLASNEIEALYNSQKAKYV